MAPRRVQDIDAQRKVFAAIRLGATSWSLFTAKLLTDERSQMRENACSGFLRAVLEWEDTCAKEHLRSLGHTCQVFGKLAFSLDEINKIDVTCNLPL